MKPFRQVVDDFAGMARNAHPSKLPEGKSRLAANCSSFVRGSWKVRKGMIHADVDRKAVAIDVLRGFTLRSGDYALMFGTNTALYGKTNVTDHVSGSVASDTLTPPTSRSQDLVAYTAVLGHRCYLTDGFYAMAYWDGLSADMELAGITAPTQADAGDWTPSPTTAAGNCSVGFHAFRYRYMDTRTGYVSDPSAEYVVEVTAAGAAQLTFAINTSGATNIIRSTESKVDTIIVEMTLVDGREFFEAARADNAASSVAVSIADSALERAPLVYPEDGHGTPPTRKHVVAHRGRLWTFGALEPVLGDNTVTVTNADATVTGSSLATAGVATGMFIRFAGDSRDYEILSVDGGSNSIELTEVYAGTSGNKLFELYNASQDNLVYVSRSGYPEAFDPDDGFVVPPTDASSAPLTAGIGFGQAMLFFSLNSMWRLDWTLEPGVDGSRRLIGNRGCLNHRCVQVVETVVGLRAFALDSQGVHVFDGVNSIEVASELRELFDGTASDYPLSWSVDTETWFSVHLPRERAIRWYVAYSSASLPNLYLQLEYDRMAWSVGVQDVQKAGGVAVLGAAGNRPMLGDALGHVWIADQGTVEGGNASYGVLTAAAGSSTTVVNVDETLPTTGVGLAGAPVTWFKGDGTQETGVVKSNTASAITLHTTGDTPSSGDAGFASAPAAGDRIEVGRILAELLTREWVAPRVGKREIADWRYLYIEFSPTSSDRVFFVLIYKDGSLFTDYAGNLESGEEGGIERPGTNANYNASYWVVHANRTQGSVRIPLGLETTARLQVKILAYQPDLALEIHRLQLTGRSGEAQE